VLLRFHEGRAPDPDLADDVAALHAAARVVFDEHGLDAADSALAGQLRRFVPRYLAFMRRRDQAGARWQLGEQSSHACPFARGRGGVYGIVDRIDEIDDDGEPVLELIDYKAGSQTRWKPSRPSSA
jgi:ATP-dependent helicase/nuclease subunit B